MDIQMQLVLYNGQNSTNYESADCIHSFRGEGLTVAPEFSQGPQGFVIGSLERICKGNGS